MKLWQHLLAAIVGVCLVYFSIRLFGIAGVAIIFLLLVWATIIVKFIAIRKMRGNKK